MAQEQDMLLKLTLTPQTRAELQALLGNQADKLGRAISSAINDTLAKARTRLSQKAGDEINIRAADIKARFSLDKATRNRMTGAVDVKRKAIPLIQFIGTRQTREGVSIKVSKSKGREVLTGGMFINRGKSSGKRGVLERLLNTEAGGAGYYVRKTANGPEIHRVRRLANGRVARYPIRLRYGKTVVGYLAGTPDLLEQEKAELQKDFTARTFSKVEAILAGKLT